MRALHPFGSSLQTNKTDKQTKTYHEDFYIYFITQGFAGKNQNPFNNDYSFRVDQTCNRCPAMSFEVIIWYASSPFRFQFTNVLYQKICVQTIGMVKIGLGAFFQRLVRNILVVVIMCQIHHILFSPKFIEDCPGQSSLWMVVFQDETNGIQVEVCKMGKVSVPSWRTEQNTNILSQKVTLPAPVPPAIPKVIGFVMALLINVAIYEWKYEGG
jgi:hypothetical protein